MMGKLYLFSHNNTKLLRMFPEKSESVEEDFKNQLYKPLYQSMKINAWCIQISRGKRRITYKSELCSNQNCIRKVKVRYSPCLVR